MEEKIDKILLDNFKEGDWQTARKQLLYLFIVIGSLSVDMEVKAEIVDRIGRKNLDSEEGIKRVVWYEKGFTDCIDWLRKRQ